MTDMDTLLERERLRMISASREGIINISEADSLGLGMTQRLLIVDVVLFNAR